MEKWSIRPDPTSYDPRRHVLLLKGTMQDIAGILRRFGAMCGRPAPVNMPEGYNYSLYLHGLTQLGMERMSAALNEMCPAMADKPSAAGGLPPPGAALPAQPLTPPPLTPPAPSAPLPPLQPITPLPAPPAPALEAAPVLIPLTPEAANPPPAPVLAPPTPAPAPAAAASVAPTPLPAAAAAAPGAVLAEKPLWGLRQSLDARWTFDTLLVGSYNRFAHAAATSVVSAPGSMYNPLFLHGGPGVGKSHMIHAIGKGLAQALAEENVIVTTGARLARAATKALAAGKAGELEAALGKAKALLVDDIHLIAVTDANRAELAKLFALFFGANLQVVFTSVYPPKALGALEEALKISFAKGWAVDMKPHTAAVQTDILGVAFDKAALSLSGDEIKEFIEMLGPNQAEAVRWAKRLVTLNAIANKAGQPAKIPDLYRILFDPGVAAKELPDPKDLETARGFKPPPPGPEAINLAVLLPKGQEAMAGWVQSQFYKAAPFGVSRSFRHVLVGSYDAGQPFGVPFQIGELCERAGAQAALVVGPPADSNLAARAGEFSHAVVHILEGLDAGMGWIPHRGTVSLAHFLRAHIDISAVTAPPA